ncbi:MAG: hotdog fold thioesterase [Salinibacter sp.]
MTSSPSLPDDHDPETSPLPENLGGVAELLGIEIQAMSSKRVTATMPVTPNHHQPFGRLHGGVSVVLAESAASVGGHLAAPSGHTAVGVEVNANHVRPVREGRLTATATPLHTGRSTQVWEIKIRDEEDRLVCASRCTLGVVEQTDPPPSA